MLQTVEIRGDEFPGHQAYPFNVAPLQGRQELRFDQSISFFVGENGSGKSTLIDAIARRCGPRSTPVKPSTMGGRVSPRGRMEKASWPTSAAGIRSPGCISWTSPSPRSPRPVRSIYCVFWPSTAAAATPSSSSPLTRRY